MPRTVMIVDDDADFVAIQREVLERGGYEVLARPNSSEAEEFLKCGSLPDLIITDLMMNREDEGFTFCHLLKRDPRTSSIPVLMLTSVNTASRLSFDLKSEEARKWIKADDFADKPIRPENLLNKVKRLIG